jgi:hypothetical protein
MVPEFLVDNYLYILGIVAVIAYIMGEAEAKSKDKPVSGFVKFMLFIKQFPMALLTIVVFMVIAFLYIIVVLTLFGYARDLLENIGASFLSLPVMCLIVMVVIFGSLYLFGLLWGWLDIDSSKKIKKLTMNLDTSIPKTQDEVNCLKLKIITRKEKGRSTKKLDRRLAALSARLRVLENLKEEERKEGLNNNGQ